MYFLQLLVKSLLTVVLVDGLQNGLARTPPMGWLSWERFRCNVDCENHPETCISENLYKTMADRMVDDGYKDAGYEYVNIDDCWSNKTRDADGNLNPDAKRFPSGMKALADYVHSKGLKLGIYGDYGTKTCAGYPGSLDYMEKDANRFAEWGIDMFKMDGCYANITTMKKGYPMMRKYLEATGRPILFSCSWPDYERAVGIPFSPAMQGNHSEGELAASNGMWGIPNHAGGIDYKSVAENCNIWRNFDDIQDSWESVTSIIDYQAKVVDKWGPVVGPGNFSDPDMLIIGDFSLSLYQAQAQMALWAIMAAPLMMSNDLRAITPQFREILLNKEVIAVNQDPLGLMGKRVLQDTSEAMKVEAWTRPLTNNSYAVTIASRNSKLSVFFETTLKKLQVSGHDSYHLVELFTGADWGMYNTTAPLTVTVPPSGVIIIRATTV